MAQKSKKLRSVWHTVTGLSMHTRVATTAPRDAGAVVLVHGLGVSGTYMLPTAERFAGAHATYVPDLPGAGKSAKPPHTLDIPGLADALADWMRVVGPRSATFVANSLGCQIVVDFALRYPDYIERAVLIGPTLDPEARSVMQQVGRGFLDLWGEPLELWRILTFDYLTARPWRVARTLHYAVLDPLEEKLRRLAIPTLVIRGTRDPIAPQRWVERMTGLLPNGRLLVIPDAAHAANFMAPDDVAQAVEAFMQEDHGEKRAPVSLTAC